MAELFAGRFTAKMEDPFVVFLIGVRVNRLLAFGKWFPVTRAMPQMLDELKRQPELGLLHAEFAVTWRGAMVLQYWRSFEHLHAYASMRDAKHLPAWAAFNRNVGTDGTVGIWHETYEVAAGRYETVYANMPRWGLAGAGEHVPAVGRMSTARERMAPDRGSRNGEDGMGQRRWGWLLLGLLAVSAAAAVAQTGSQAAQDSTWLKDLQGYRAYREAHISDPEGWLATVGLDWLTPGQNTFGTAAGNRVKLEGGAGAGHLGVLVVNGDQVELQPPSGGFSALVKEDGNAPKQGALKTDEHPTTLTAGPLAMIVIKRGGRFALRVRDSSAPARLSFTGLHWYEPDPRYRIEATWVPYAPPHSLMIPTEIGVPDKMASPGVAEFKVNGRAVRLEPVLESADAKQLFFILRDRTSSKESYGAGRFLYTEFPDHGLEKPGKVMLDFNRLENPACAFTAYATCPLPPRQNRLDVSLPVGEKKYHD